MYSYCVINGRNLFSCKLLQHCVIFVAQTDKVCIVLASLVSSLVDLFALLK